MTLPRHMSFESALPKALGFSCASFSCIGLVPHPSPPGFSHKTVNVKDVPKTHPAKKLTRTTVRVGRPLIVRAYQSSRPCWLSLESPS
jgi:hypothetical protein